MLMAGNTLWFRACFGGEWVEHALSVAVDVRKHSSVPDLDSSESLSKSASRIWVTVVRRSHGGMRPREVNVGGMKKTNEVEASLCDLTVALKRFN